MKNITCINIIILVFFFVNIAFAQNRNQLSYQGRVSQEGKPYSGKATVSFAIGNLWTEQQEVDIRNGIYSIALGKVTPIPSTIFSSTGLSLRITFNGKTLVPDVPFYPVPYSYMALSVEKNAIEGYMIKDKTIESKHLANGAIKTTNLETNSINTTLIADKSILPADLKPEGTNKVMIVDANGEANWADQNIFTSANNTLTQGKIWIGNADNLRQEITFLGDITMDYLGFVTINSGVINSAKILDGSILNIDLADNSVNSNKILDNSIVPIDIASGGTEKVLTTNANGVVNWADKLSLISASTGWALTGNANTVAGTNFIGTTDAQPLVFKANGQSAGRIDITDLSSDANTFYGYQAGKNNTTGFRNVFSGYQSGFSNTTGRGNVFTGVFTGYTNTTGYGNIFSAPFAGYSNQSGYENIFLGVNAGYSNTTGFRNVSVGLGSGFFNIGGNNNVFLGYNAGYNETSSDKLYIANSNTANPLIYGDFANKFISVNGNLVIGYNNIPATAGDGMLAFNTGAFYGYTGGNWNKFATVSSSFTTAILQGGNSFNTAVVIGSTDNFPLIFKANNQQAGLIDPINFNTFLGINAGRNTTGIGRYNLAIGEEALRNNLTGSYNVANGYQALLVSTGDGNVANGVNAAFNNTSGNRNVASGYQVLYHNLTGSENVVSGYQAGNNFTNINNSVMIGTQAGGALGSPSLTPATGNVFIGNRAGGSETGSNKLYIANSTTTTPLLGGTFGTTTALSFLTVNGNLNITNFATAESGLQLNLGANSFIFPTTRGTANQVLQTDGAGATSWAAAGGGGGWGLTGNTGTTAGANFLGTTDDVALVLKVNGVVAGKIDNSTGTNTFLGYETGLTNIATNTSNTFIGHQAGKLTTNAANTAVGFQALSANAGGYSNSAIGHVSMVNNTSGFDNTAMGRATLHNNSTGSQNTAIGQDALLSNTTGTQNTGLGNNTNVSTGNLTNATAVGFGAVIDASNKIRLGNAAVTVIEGQVAFTNPSDRRLKENIQDSELGLGFIRKIRPVQYSMIKGNGKTDYGFIAQELEIALDGRKVNMLNKDGEYYTVRYNDLIAPSVKAIQELAQKVEALEKENAQLKLEKAGLKSELEGKIQNQQTELDSLKKQMSQILELLGKPKTENGKK